MNDGKSTRGNSRLFPPKRFLLRATFLGLFSLLIAFGGSGCGQKQPSDAPVERRENYIPITKNLSAAATLTLYEGLPNPDDSYPIFEKEAATKKILSIHKYVFYETALDVSTEDVEKLRHLLTSSNTFAAGRRKRCGFHPDYCLKWKDQTESYDVLLCFTCKEAKTYSSGNLLDNGIQEHGYDQLAAILKKYAKQRPQKSVGK